MAMGMQSSEVEGSSSAGKTLHLLHKTARVLPSTQNTGQLHVCKEAFHFLEGCQVLLGALGRPASVVWKTMVCGKHTGGLPLLSWPYILKLDIVPRVGMS